jgi:hypothetical protein
MFTPDGHLVSDWGGNDTTSTAAMNSPGAPSARRGVAPTTMHFIGNHFAEIDVDEAMGITYCIANHLRADRSNLVMMVRYLDRFVRGSDGEWLIADRSVVIDWTETRQADPADSV